MAVPRNTPRLGVLLCLVLAGVWLQPGSFFLGKLSYAQCQRATFLRGQREEAPSWRVLEERLPSTTCVEPRVIDSALQPERPKLCGLTLFRERNGWCPYSERVWLAFEAKGLAYDTVLIDNMGSRPAWFNGQTPQVRWEDGRTQGESNDIIRKLDTLYPDTPKLWYSEEVTSLVDAFRTIFPKGTRPSSRAAFLFKGWGATPVPRTEFEATLDGANDLLGRYDDGPFFHGACFSAADCIWAPFLERYSYQLPCLHAGLQPRDSSRWPRLGAWYEAMMQQMPAYGARIQGDDVSWRRVLQQAGFGNAGIAPQLLSEGDSACVHLAGSGDGDWVSFAESRPYVARTACEEAAARIVRNRQAIAADAVKQGALEQGMVETALRRVVELLLQDHGDVGAKCSDPVVAAAVAYLDERLCVPRDMGLLPARALRSLAASLCSRKLP